MIEIIQMLIPALIGIGGGALGGYLFYKRKHPIEVKDAQVKIEAAELNGDKIKWDFQQKIINDMNTELDKREEKHHEEAKQRDADCEKRISEVEEKLNGKVESIISEIREKCINNCLDKEYSR